MKTEILEFIGMVADKKCKVSLSASINSSVKMVSIFIKYGNNKIFYDYFYYDGELSDKSITDAKLSEWKTRLNRIKDDK